MIDWESAGTQLAAALGGRQGLKERAERSGSKWPRYQNTSYPLVPLPVIIPTAAAAEHAATVEQYVGLLEKAIALYRADSAVREYFGLDSLQEELVRAPSGLRREVCVCRLDGYLNAHDGSIQILEHNADAPAGTLFTGRLNGLVEEVASGVLGAAGCKLVPSGIDRADALLSTLLQCYRESGGKEAAPRIAILQETGKSNVESLEMAAEYTARGVETLVVDPKDLVFEANAVSHARRPIHIIWNKLNTVYWNQLLTRSPSWLRSWCDAIQRRLVCHINPFSSRYIVENKRSVAFFQEDQFATSLTESERQLVRRILPWSRKLEMGKRVELDGVTHDLWDLVWQRQVDFVLKEPYDIRGDGVTIGRAVDRQTWERSVQRGFEEGHVVQRFVRALTYPILELGANATVVPMTISLDSFVLGGRFAGFGSKASLNDKVNLFQGGRKVAVRIGARA